MLLSPPAGNYGKLGGYDLIEESSLPGSDRYFRLTYITYHEGAPLVWEFRFYVKPDGKIALNSFAWSDKNPFEYLSTGDMQLLRSYGRQAMLTELKLIRDLLSKHGFGGLAGVVDALVGLKESDDPSFPERLNDIAMWGGAGAVWEVIFDPLGVSPNQDEVNRDKLAFMQAFVDLVEDMEREGIASARASEIGSVFKEWVQGGPSPPQGGRGGAGA